MFLLVVNEILVMQFLFVDCLEPPSWHQGLGGHVFSLHFLQMENLVNAGQVKFKRAMYGSPSRSSTAAVSAKPKISLLQQDITDATVSAVTACNYEIYFCWLVFFKALICKNCNVEGLQLY